jgi:glyoxylase-like metal-dependent hydrolase (beta-lactamase superfamily II)
VRLAALKDPNTPLPDQTVRDRRTINLGGTTVELRYVGRNHSDSTLVTYLPREKIIFVVDLLPVGRMSGRGMIDFYPMEAEQSIQRILAMDWERLIPGHPDGGRLGSKKTVEEQLKLLQVASAEGKRLGQGGKCWLPGEKEFTIAGYENFEGYADGLPFIARRYCGLWGRGT